MKEFKECIFYIGLFAIGLSFGAFYNIDLDAIDKQMIEVTGSDYNGFKNFKRDCEKSLPSNKVCVMVFEYVEVSNDYEAN